MILVCFDLGLDTPGRLQQITYWLDYLHSLLSPANPSADFLDKWRIVLVGLRSDLGPPVPKTGLFVESIPTWKQTWPNLPLHSEVITTSKTNTASVDHLWSVVTHECDMIMAKFTKQIPSSYQFLLSHLKAIAQSTNSPMVSIKDNFANSTEQQFMPGLRYLHAVGDIVLLPGGLICTDPTEISRMMAKFVSPESVQQTLPHIAQGKAVILTSEQAGKIMLMQENDPNLLEELRIMSHFGICYQLPTVGKNSPSFLFPSLSKECGGMHNLIVKKNNSSP